MTDKNPQNAKAGDLIMWPNFNGGGLNYGKIVSFSSDGRPMAKSFWEPWFEKDKIVDWKFEADPSGWTWGEVDGQRVRGRSVPIREEVNIQHPLRWSHARRVTSGWVVLAYGDGRVETTEAEHPIAKAKRQFMELESKYGFAF